MRFLSWLLFWLIYPAANAGKLHGTANAVEHYVQTTGRDGVQRCNRSVTVSAGPVAAGGWGWGEATDEPSSQRADAPGTAREDARPTNVPCASRWQRAAAGLKAFGVRPSRAQRFAPTTWSWSCEDSLLWRTLLWPGRPHSAVWQRETAWRSYDAESGTVSDKLGFCQRALNHLESLSALSPETQDLTKRLYEFVRSNNP